MVDRRRPGAIRDAILETLTEAKKPMDIGEIIGAVESRLGEPVASSSVRSYLRLNTPERFERTGRGTYKVRKAGARR